MKSKKAVILFAVLATVLMAVRPAFAAVTLTVGSGSAAAGDTIQIPVTVDVPVGIAGAAFTITYDGDSLYLVDIQSDFFDTFGNQWSTLEPQPDPYPPGSVEVDGGLYTQPLIENVVSETGSMIAAARSSPETSFAKTTLFTLTFALKPGASAGTFPVWVVSTTLNHTGAGYNPGGETVPMLVGVDASKAADDPDAYVILLDPSNNVGSTVSGSITFIDDLDNDQVPDQQDAFPNDPDEWLDTDEDGIGNNADLDDDNDGMPDEWEEQFGLDPLLADASGDLDGDGITNLEEYQADSDPSVVTENLKPDQPVLSSPFDGATGVPLAAALGAEEFSDPDISDTHVKTQWQVSHTPDFSDLVLDVTSGKHLSALVVPQFVLNLNTTYHWRIRFFDNHDAESIWSEPYSFTTIAVSLDDSDTNGIPDHQQVDASVDLDHDGTPDVDQNNIKCVKTADGSKNIGIKGATNVTSIEYLQSIDPDTISITENKPEGMPLGLINFKLNVDNAGDTVSVTVYLSEAAPAGAKWFKFDPVNGWQDYSEHATFSSDNKSVILEFKDGGFGDADGTENAVVIDPSGIAAGGPSSTPAVDSSSGTVGAGGAASGGGCFIATAAYGSLMTTHVQLLKDFRDRCLLTHTAGRAFVRLYYTYSPAGAEFIVGHDILRTAVHISLLPIAGTGWVVLNLGPVNSLAIAFVLCCGFVGLVRFKRK